MVSCKNCLHVEACKSKCIIFGYVLNENDYVEVCGLFKNRSQFVKLPCKLGDEIFCTTMGKIHQGIVGRIELDDEGIAIITTDGYCFDSSICYHTQKEAEQSLKEREG